MQSMSFWNCNIYGIFFIYQLHVRRSKVRKQKCTYWVYNLKLKTRKQKNKNLTIELVARSEIKYFSTSS